LRAVLVDHARLRQQGPRLMELLAAALDGSGPALLPLDAGLPAGRLRELLATFGPDQVQDPDGVITGTGGGTGAGTTARSGVIGGDGDTAVIVGTSGSTGGPKGVELSAAALLHSARASLARIGARPGERWLCCLPVSHIAGIQVLTRSLVSEAEPVFDTDPAAGHDCLHVSLVPTQLSRLSAGALTGFKSVLLGGAAAPPGMVERARDAGVPVWTTYGMTETCGGCVYDGIPLDGVQVAVRDDEAGSGPGRIWIGGPVLFSGYFGEARATGWFRTGDLGSTDGDGLLTVRGRADDVINTGGHKVVPGEVAAVLQACPGVKDAVVVGESDPEWGERVVAVVVAADPADPPTLKMLRMRVKDRLPRYAAPSRVVLVEAVPMLPSGKPDLMRLRQDLASLRELERLILRGGNKLS
jgi:o-succinylbenzoate---CoA ligase